MQEIGRRRAVLAGAAFAALVTLSGLGIGTLWDNSETAYGEVAREILLLHDAVVMHFNAVPWFVQPPLYFWLAALGAKLFGIGSFALRLPSALATIAMGAFSAAFVQRAAGPRPAFYATLILSSSLMQAALGRLAIMDALLDLTVLVAIGAWWEAFSVDRTRAARDRAFILGTVAAAFGTLAKGPVAIVVPLIVLLPALVWEARLGRGARPSLRAWIAGCAAYFGICAPWAILVAKSAGPAALAELVGHYTIGRYVGTIENQSGPVYYYVPVIVLGFFPWVAFLFPAMRCAFREVSAPRAAVLRLALCWAIAPFVFFSLAQTKLPNYIALEFPALAIIAAIWFDRIAERGERRGALIAAAIVPLTIGIAVFAAVVFSRNNRLPVPPELTADLSAVAAIALAGSVLVFGLLTRRATIKYAVPVLAGSAAVWTLVGVFVALPYADALKPIPPLAAVIERERRLGDVIAIENASGENALMFYTSPPVVALDGNGSADDRATDPRRTICGSKRVFLVTTRDPSSARERYGRARRVLATVGKDVLYLFEGAPCSPDRSG